MSLWFKNNKINDINYFKKDIKINKEIKILPKSYQTSGKPILGTGSFGEVVKIQEHYLYSYENIINNNQNNQRENQINKGGYNNQLSEIKYVAIKTIKSQIARQQPHYCLYLYRELYMLRNMKHPNIITLKDVKAPKYDQNNLQQYEEGGLDGSLDTLQLVFECADCDLAKYLHSRRRSKQNLTDYECQYILYQLALATKYIHSANIIHRDIKPENILVWASNLTIKLTDFGLARIIPPCTPNLPITPTAQSNQSFFDTPNSQMDLESGYVSNTISTSTSNSTDGDHTHNHLNGNTDTRPRSDSTSSTSSQRDSFTLLLQTQQQAQQQEQQAQLQAQQQQQQQQNQNQQLSHDYLVEGPPALARHLTQHVVSRWYRAPEIILLQQYHTAIDVWSMGCVFGDLLSCGRPLFPGSAVAPLSIESLKDGQKGEDSNMLSVIFRILGGPTNEEIDSFPDEDVREYLRKYQGIEPDQTLAEKYPIASSLAISLLSRMISFTVENRITVQEVLDHSYFDLVRSQLQENDITMSQGLVMNIIPKKRDTKQKRELCQKIMDEVNYYTRKYESLQLLYEANEKQSEELNSTDSFAVV